MATMEKEKLVHLEEIKLLKDYVYGLDPKAKEVHMHKFVKNGGNNDTLFSSDDFLTNQENETSMCASKSLSKKFTDVVQKVYYKGAISFRENIDPKILVNNLKSEIEMTEQQLITYKEIEQ